LQQPVALLRIEPQQVKYIAPVLQVRGLVSDEPLAGNAVTIHRKKAPAGGFSVRIHCYSYAIYGFGVKSCRLRAQPPSLPWLQGDTELQLKQIRHGYRRKNASEGGSFYKVKETDNAVGRAERNAICEGLPAFVGQWVKWCLSEADTAKKGNEFTTTFEVKLEKELMYSETDSNGVSSVATLVVDGIGDKTTQQRKDDSWLTAYQGTLDRGGEAAGSIRLVPQASGLLVLARKAGDGDDWEKVAAYPARNYN